MAEKTRALLATSRIANIPSVISNVWLGVVIASMGNPSVVDFPKAALHSVAGVALYVAGNFFNDWHDRQWDADHRPERALPRGLFFPGLYLALACTASAIALAIGLWTGSSTPVVALLTLIILYTRFHKCSPWAILAMGSCRAMLLPLGAACIVGQANGEGIACGMLGLASYIAGISLNARYESLPNPPLPAMIVAKSLLLGAGLILATIGGFSFSLLPFAAWLALALAVFRKPLSRQVSALLAGIPLLDGIVILPLAIAAGWPIDCWTAVLWIPPLAFLAALLLQRLSPAT